MNGSPHQEPSPRLTILAFLIVGTAILVGAILLLASRPEPVNITVNPPLPTATPEPTATPAPITIYITGAVAEPEQLLTLPPGSRVQDAIQAVGGVTDTADLERVNLAAILRDGDQVHVPKQGQETVLPTPGGGVIVHVNTATIEELDDLPGVGPELAARIVEYRQSNGPFQSLEDLDAVSGVGPALLESWTDLIAFD